MRSIYGVTYQQLEEFLIANGEKKYRASQIFTWLYEKNVQDRNQLRYLIGLIVRWKQNFKYARARRIARKRGATIGEGVIMPISLAKRANSNLTIGNHSSIQTNKIDIRSSVTIGSHVIIGAGTEIITTSHNIDSPDWTLKNYGITIEDYVWIPTNVLILPSCRNISYGSVIGSGSVVVKNTDPMSVVGGNPAKELRKRKLAFGEVLTSEAIDKLIKDLKLKDLDDIYLALGSLRYTASYIINLINNDKHNVEDALLEKKRDLPKINYKGDILVEGQSNIMVNIAKCCMPVKGDEIIGYITKGQGISVHKKECPNIPQDSERAIDVAWNMDSNNYYYTNIYVTIKDNKDILAEVITEVGKKNSLVRSCKTIQKNDNLVYELNIRIADKDELEKICNGILKLSDVLEVNKSL